MHKSPEFGAFPFAAIIAAFFFAPVSPDFAPCGLFSLFVGTCTTTRENAAQGLFWRF